ncbi:hypothetical protein SLEP1_g28924 [Rubroshorea leprosula]|uniref:Bet v I/Major latex protein domain-containing protein n=1 Tax=Rubroshorea leprosula TaxID=152421 RepID=A0AAV5K0Y5_9ROSI|nr:hypothetical protein SLEP1_g28924 [Rubroshorea leprosula]
MGALRHPKILEAYPEGFKDVIHKLELVEGDGGVGTIIKLDLVPESGVIPGITWYKEKFTKIDNEKRVKETEDVEGGYLDLGFTLYRVRFEVIEKDKDSCSIKSTVEYDIKEEAAANASIITIQPLAKIAELAKDQLISIKA